MVFAGLVGGFGLWLLVHYVNALTMWLTLATFVGYAVVYTVILKPLTPQNIVIGGASGAMPPVLGWAAVTGEVSTDALLLFLIIFAWTPPHFWSLALYRTEDYARAGVPMLPVTHGKDYTRLQVLLYTLILFGVSLLPYAVAHERLAVSRGRGRARPDLRRLCGAHLHGVQRPAGTKLLPLFDRVSRRAVRGAAR